MEIVYQTPDNDKSLLLDVSINHQRETLRIRQGKESIVMTFEQLSKLFKDANFYNQLETA